MLLQALVAVGNDTGGGMWFLPHLTLLSSYPEVSGIPKTAEIFHSIYQVRIHDPSLGPFDEIHGKVTR